jgi:CRISPR-associated protein Cmr3
LRPLWLSNNEPTEPVSGFLAASAMARFLNGQCVCLEDLVESNALYSHDERTGIGIDPDRLSAAQSLIYGAKFLSLRPARARAADHGDAVDVQFYAEVHLPDGAPDFAKASLNALATLPFGGEGRRVVCRWLKNAFDWSALQPAWPAQEASRKTFYLLTTPGLFAARWRPACLAGRLVAAAVPGATAVSGWDLARGGPKRTRFAALPGSVYFVDQPVDAFCPSLSDDPQDQRQGWGCFLRGVWIDD